MKTPAAVDSIVVRFDRMSLRERLLIFAAVLAAVVMGWNGLFMDKLSKQEKSLSVELNELQESVSRTGLATEAVASRDPETVARQRLAEREKALEAINAKLTAESAGLIPPAQMVVVIHDVLKHQNGLTLVSLRNLPVASLVSPAELKRVAGASEGQADANSVQRADEEGASSAGADGTGAAGPDGSDADGASVSADTSASSMPAGNLSTGSSPDPGLPGSPDENAGGPYLHPVELIVEGRYLDIVAYLHALEALPYRFYWRVLELETKTYPLNRVRIELSTVSLDKEWIGV